MSDWRRLWSQNHFTGKPTFGALHFLSAKISIVFSLVQIHMVLLNQLLVKSRKCTFLSHVKLMAWISSYNYYKTDKVSQIWQAREELDLQTRLPKTPHWTHSWCNKPNSKLQSQIISMVEATKMLEMLSVMYLCSNSTRLTNCVKYHFKSHLRRDQ